MIHSQAPKFAASTPDSIPLTLVAQDSFDSWITSQSKSAQNWMTSHGFKGALGQFVALSDSAGKLSGLVVGYGTAKMRRRKRFGALASIAQFPSATYHLATDLDAHDCEAFCLAWLLSSYRFDRYKAKPALNAHLIAPQNLDHARIELVAAGEFMTRDLINTPAADMGPTALEAAFRKLGEHHNASMSSIVGDKLLDANFPMIHAVGRAAADAPRLLDMRWGSVGPTLTLVGKGVCFDTGGLNIKPASSMGLMKKDMGGAATVLGLAHMIMGLGLKLQLRVLIPAVENNIDGNAFRPQDILTSRKGLTVEINNTDAEGRLVLADALALACEENPDLLISMATLTGAARVAVGPDLAPFYCDDEAVAAALCDMGDVVQDPVWRMPFWEPYEAMIEPDVADLDNAPKGGFAGSITAALFLRRFVSETQRYAHFDIYGWQPSPQPARPVGGIGQGARAVLDALPDLLDL
jgi:leucyl aminopeptidase